MRSILICVTMSVVFCLPNLGFSIPPTTVPSTQPVAGDDLLKQAIEALHSGDFLKAADLATRQQVQLRRAKTLPKDPAVVNAVHVEGVALIRQGQLKRAGDVLRKVYASLPGNRSLVVNLAICDIADKELVKAAIRNLGAFAATHPQDEEVVNLWGYAINAVETEGKSSKVREFWAAYAKVNTQLEATRKGERRWGTDWLPSPTVAAKEQEQMAHRRTIDDASAELKQAIVNYDRALSAYKDAEGALAGAFGPIKCSFVGDNCLECCKRRARAAEQAATNDMAFWKPRAEAAKNNYDREVAAMPRPNWAVPMMPAEPELMH